MALAHAPRARHVRNAAWFTMFLTLVSYLGLAFMPTKDNSASAAVAASGLPDLDQRFIGIQVPPSTAQLAALSLLGDVEVGWTEVGTPHSLRAKKGALTAPSADGPDTVARRFLAEQATLFRLSPTDVAGLELSMLDPDQSGATFLRYRQKHGDRLVHNSSILVALDHEGRIIFAGGTFAPDLQSPIPPAISADQAVAIVAADVTPLGAVVPVERLILPLPGESTAIFKNTMALPAMTNPAPVVADIVTVPNAWGGRTAWRVRSEIASNADYETLVDASTGAIIYRKNQWSHSEPHGLVHTGDDPEAGAQTPDVPFSGLDGSWVAGTTTSGNNVNAYQDLFDDETPDAGDQPTNADQHFDYAFTNGWGTSGVLPTTGDDRDAVVTQLFYYTNWFHDYAYGLGFTETSGNFQTNNFGRGGAGGDAVRAESDDSYGDGTTMLCTNSSGNPVVCRNNANFHAGGPDGSTPRMQMYVGDDGRRTQRANNRDTVIHEYGHGVSGRIISDGNLAGGLQSGALGEGWSDALATSINNDPVYGEYNNGNYTTGIRGVDYSNSARQYGDLCTLHPDGCQVHADGTIWATAMWEQRAALIAKHGFAAGKALHERLLILGMKLTPNEPSFHNARSGYLAADAFLGLFGVPNAGNSCLLWRVFADNELGVTAGPDDDNDSSPTISTATPSECAPEAVITGTLTGPEGNDISLSGVDSVTNGDSGDVLSYAWDLDNDSQYDDSTSPNPTFTDVGNDGVFPVSLRVTNTAGYTDTMDANITVTNVGPSINLSHDLTMPEGSPISVQGLVTDPGWEDDLQLTIDWKDGSPVQNISGAEENGRPDASLGFYVEHVYGDNGNYPVEICRSDDDTSLCQSVNLAITNVAPTVTIDPAQLTNLQEGQTLPVVARFTDPGWLDTYPSSNIDPGSPDLPSTPGTVTIVDEGPPMNEGTISGNLTYGDNGTFTIAVDIVDDDGGSGADSFNVQVHNVDPTATIDETGSVLVNGVPTFFADINQTLPFAARIQDPGSDDETTWWSWGDSTGSLPTKSRVNPAFDDPLPSPNVFARDFSVSDVHSWSEACMYEVGVTSQDDDNGTGDDAVAVLITNSPSLSRGAGYWQHQYKGNGSIEFSHARLDCYLAIASFVSNVFNEVRDASTRQKAHDDIFVAGLRGDLTQQLDRQLLTSWINFANGGVEYNELLDTNGDLIPDADFITIMTTAESVRLNPGSTRDQLAAQRNVLTRINGRDGV